MCRREVGMFGVFVLIGGFGVYGFVMGIMSFGWFCNDWVLKSVFLVFVVGMVG